MRQTGGYNRCHLHGLLYLPTKGRLTCSKGRKGTALFLPDLHDLLLQGFLQTKSLTRLNPPSPKRALCCSKEAQV